MAQVVKYPLRKEIKTEKNNISGYWIAAVYASALRKGAGGSLVWTFFILC